jgi:hypothetical protein
MKARSEMLFKLLKTRSSSGVGNQFMMHFNPNTLILECFTEEDEAANRSKSLASYVRGHVAKKKEESDAAAPPQQTAPRDSSVGKLDINRLPFQI